MLQKNIPITDHGGFSLNVFPFLKLNMSSFSRMRSEGFSFCIWGSGGVDPCSRDPAFGVRNRLQPSSTVRLGDRLWAQKLPCLWEKSQKRDLFDVSEAVVMSFCVAGVALRGIPTCFTTRQRVVLCGRAQYFCLHFQKMCCIFRGRRSTLGTSDVIFHGRRSTLDVSCCCSLRIAMPALREVVTRCKFRGRRGRPLHETSILQSVDKKSS